MKTRNFELTKHKYVIFKNFKRSKNRQENYFVFYGTNAYFHEKSFEDDFLLFWLNYENS